MLRVWNMGTHHRARKNDTIGATQNAPSHHTNQKKIQKKAWNTKVKISKELDNIDSSCTDDESEDGKSSVSHSDQDSNVSFESDEDEEIDAVEIEEEDWVDYIERSTNEAMEKMENEKIRCWNKIKTWNGDWRWELPHHRAKNGW